MEKDIPIPHPTETPKEKNFDMKRETPIHVNSHLKVRLTRSILTKQANFKPVNAMEENHWIDVTLYKRLHTTTHYATFREPNLQL